MTETCENCRWCEKVNIDTKGHHTLECRDNPPFFEGVWATDCCRFFTPKTSNGGMIND